MAKVILQDEHSPGRFDDDHRRQRARRLSSLKLGAHCNDAGSAHRLGKCQPRLANLEVNWSVRNKGLIDPQA